MTPVRTVLLVDDDEICNMISVSTLTRLNIATKIHVTLSGAQAIDLLNESSKIAGAIPDIILLDLNMPVMDGFGFVDAFQKLSLPNKESIRIIIVTSSLDPKDIEKATKMGIDRVLIKPLSDEKLLAALQ